jgi:hypothetical protein
MGLTHWAFPAEAMFLCEPFSSAVPRLLQLAHHDIFKRHSWDTCAVFLCLARVAGLNQEKLDHTSHYCLSLSYGVVYVYALFILGRPTLIAPSGVVCWIISVIAAHKLVSELTLVSFVLT